MGRGEQWTLQDREVLGVVSHGEVGDESLFGDLDVEADALGFGARVDHRAPDSGVGEARRDAALHLVAFHSDVIATNGLENMREETSGRFRTPALQVFVCVYPAGYLSSQ